MPFKSKAQRRYLYATHPAIAKRFQEHTPKNAKLPERISSPAATTSKTAALSPLLRRFVTAFASMNQAQQAMNSRPPIYSPGLLAKTLTTTKTAQDDQSTPLGLHQEPAFALGRVQKQQLALEALYKLAGLRPPLPQLPTSIFPKPGAIGIHQPGQATQVPTIQAQLGLPQPNAPSNALPNQRGQPQQQSHPTTGQPQDPRVRHQFNQKSVYGAGPLSNTGIAGVGMNLNPVHAGLAMKRASAAADAAGVIVDNNSLMTRLGLLAGDRPSSFRSNPEAGR